MAAVIPDISALVLEATQAFQEEFSLSPDIVVSAPGRVNLIGEHTDYNAGFVLPMALPLATVIVGRASKDKGTCRIKSLQYLNCDVVTIPIPFTTNILSPSEPMWANYVKGVVANFHDTVVGFDIIITSSVPLGGGLSSSASLEVATYTFLEALTGSKATSLKSKALACQKAEHEFAKVPCGIMDQFISTMGVKGSALLIDCRSLDSQLVPLSDPNVTFVIINSNVKHALSGSEYPARRNQCFAAANILNKSSLREASLQHLEQNEFKMDEEMLRRAKHVITEIERTQKAADAIKYGDYSLFGDLMTASHASLKNDFEVSCHELDELVEISLSVPGVFGSRMTGGGFGGCTVNLVKQNNVLGLINKVKENFKGHPTFYVCSPADGAAVLKGGN